MESVGRVCVKCGGPISFMQGSTAKFCRGCRDRQARVGGKELHLKRRAVEAKKADKFLVHSCLSNALDPWDASRCQCRLLIAGSKAERLIGRGDGVDFDTRKQIFCERSIVIVGKLKQTPRSQTVEKAHIERISEESSLGSRDREKIKQFQAAIGEDKGWRERERLESDRADFYQFLTVQALNIRQVPAEEYDEMVRNDYWRGRALFNRGAFKDERTAVGVDGLNLRTAIEVEKEAEHEDVEHEDTEQDAEETLTVKMEEEMDAEPTEAILVGEDQWV